MFKGLVVIALVALIPAQSMATEPFAKVGTYALQFLKIPVSARGVAMGNAFTALSDDATATYWNPAGMVDVTRTSISLNHTWWPADISLDFASAVFTLPFVPGQWGVSARSLSMDPQVERTIFLPDGTGQSFDAGDMSFGLSYAKFFTDKFSSGATIHFIHSGLADKSVNTFARSTSVWCTASVCGECVWGCSSRASAPRSTTTTASRRCRPSSRWRDGCHALLSEG